jgi:hypothetical protein
MCEALRQEVSTKIVYYLKEQHKSMYQRELKRHIQQEVARRHSMEGLASESMRFAFWSSLIAFTNILQMAILSCLLFVFASSLMLSIFVCEYTLTPQGRTECTASRYVSRNGTVLVESRVFDVINKIMYLETDLVIFFLGERVERTCQRVFRYPDEFPSVIFWNAIKILQV